MNCLSAKRFVLLYHKKKSSLEKDWIFVYYKIGPRKSWKKKKHRYRRIIKIQSSNVGVERVVSQLDLPLVTPTRHLYNNGVQPRGSVTQ